MDTPESRTTETKSADATKTPPRRFDLTRLLTQRDRLPLFWFFFTVAVLLLSAIDRYHIVSQFKQRERVVIIDPADTCYLSPLLQFSEAKDLHFHFRSEPLSFLQMKGIILAGGAGSPPPPPPPGPGPRPPPPCGRPA